MTIYRLTPANGVPVLRQAATLQGATTRGLREFPAGLRSVKPVGLPELVSLAAEGWPLPVAARQRLKIYKAVQREKAKADARVEALRDKQREKVRNKREEEALQREALKEQQNAERAAENKRKAAAPPPAVALPVDASDSRLPWED